MPTWLEWPFVWAVLKYRRLRYGYPFRKIPLTQGKFAIVDPEDYAHLSRYKWHFSRAGTNYYALRKQYCKATKRWKTIQMHRCIFPIADDLFIDHINGNGLDNRKANLRPATPAQNCLNRRPSAKNKTSKYKGVCKRKGHCGWTALIGYNGRQINLGTFAKEKDAAKAYDKAARKYHGEFAVLNFPK